MDDRDRDLKSGKIEDVSSLPEICMHCRLYLDRDRRSRGVTSITSSLSSSSSLLSLMGCRRFLRTVVDGMILMNVTESLLLSLDSEMSLTSVSVFDAGSVLGVGFEATSVGVVGCASPVVDGFVASAFSWGSVKWFFCEQTRSICEYAVSDTNL